MGVDLHLYPQRSKTIPSLLHDKLCMEGQRDLFGLIRDKLPTVPWLYLVDEENWPSRHTDEGIVTVSMDDYDEPLRVALAKDFGPLLREAKKAGVKPYRWNEAIFRFIAAMPPGTPIVLFWT